MLDTNEINGVIVVTTIGTILLLGALGYLMYYCFKRKRILEGISFSLLALLIVAIVIVVLV